MWRYVGFGVLALAAAGLASAHLSYREGVDDAQQAMRRLVSEPRAEPAAFWPAMVADLPEVARRSFLHAIAPGTLLRKSVRLEMAGTFVLGDKAAQTRFRMEARQVLSPPDEFVWIASMRSGLMSISGSDALVDGKAWTRFWVAGLVPVVSQRSSPDLNRSAATRSAVEGIWAPASLLPGNGVTWQQVGVDDARLHFAGGQESVDLHLDRSGRVLDVRTLRWSDANPEKTFKLQPFGGTMEAEGSFDGFTIPTHVKVGNHFGLEGYFPFFDAVISAAEYF